MRSYEVVLIVHPEVEGDDVKAVIDDVEQLIERSDGDVTYMEPWGLRKLAYPIRKQQEGHYVLLQFDLEPQSVADLEHGLQLMEPVMRHLVVRAE